MSPNERRIIHVALMNKTSRPKVRQWRKRKVTIFPLSLTFRPSLLSQPRFYCSRAATALMAKPEAMFQGHHRGYSDAAGRGGMALCD